MFGPGLFAALAVSASVVLGQAEWEAGQINTRICQWQQLRAAVLRDTVYLDGGNLWWTPGFANGETKAPKDDRNPLGHIYMLNFSTPFSTADNISDILGVLTTGGGGTNRHAPTYEDGALLGNDAEFFLYGGMMGRPFTTPDPDGDEVMYYEKYQYGPERPLSQQFNYKQLPENLTRYITYGGAASAPSENLAWYFSGMQSESKGKIYKPGSNDNGSFDATYVAETLITLDMKRQRFETFRNDSLQGRVPGRANPELVWVPVGRRGILVALGGVVYPEFVFGNMTSADEQASTRESPEFMSTIDIYDVAGEDWYRQKTTGGPRQLTRGCAVVARARDGSSFNIYYYGGYDGLHSTQPFSSEVWVLSLPSFTWVKLASGGADGRAGHKCVMPYPDQMLAIGGYQAQTGRSLPCLEETIRVLNLSSGEWLTRYDPAVYADYTVPSLVVDKIGGSGTGDATATTPSPSWDSIELAGVFREQYPMSKITTYYPYASVARPNNTNPDAPPPDTGDDGGGGLPSYLPPVLGVVLGLVFLTMVAVLILLWRRRRLLRRSGTASEAGTEDTNGNRIASWLRGQPTEVKTPTMTNSSEYLPVSSTEVDSNNSTNGGAPPMSIAEMMDTGVQIAELPDNSPPAELHSAALSPTAAAAATASLNNNTNYPSTHQTDHASTPSPPPHPTPPPIPHGEIESPIFYRPDSDALGRGGPAGTTGTTSTTTSPTGTTTTTTGASPIAAVMTSGSGSGRSNKVLSGISNLSERDRAHLRQISDTTVSSVTTAPGGGAGGGGGAASSNGGNGNGNGNGNGTGERERERMLSGVSALSGVTGAGIYGGGGGVGDSRAVSTVAESPAVVSPPTATAGPGEGVDYLSARPLQNQGQQQQGQQGPGSPLRRSVFSEDISGGEESGPPRGG